MTNQNSICPECHQQQWSMMDQDYLKLFNTCWSCDKSKWEHNQLSIEEFEKREEQAILLTN